MEFPMNTYDLDCAHCNVKLTAKDTMDDGGLFEDTEQIYVCSHNGKSCDEVFCQYNTPQKYLCEICAYKQMDEIEQEYEENSKDVSSTNDDLCDSFPSAE